MTLAKIAPAGPFMLETDTGQPIRSVKAGGSLGVTPSTRS